MHTSVHLENPSIRIQSELYNFRKMECMWTILMVPGTQSHLKACGSSYTISIMKHHCIFLPVLLQAADESCKAILKAHQQGINLQTNKPSLIVPCGRKTPCTQKNNKKCMGCVQTISKSLLSDKLTFHIQGEWKNYLGIFSIYISLCVLK